MTPQDEAVTWLIRKQVPQLLDDLIQDLVKQKPADALAYVHQWLGQKQGGVDAGAAFQVEPCVTELREVVSLVPYML